MPEVDSVEPASNPCRLSSRAFLNPSLAEKLAHITLSSASVGSGTLVSFDCSTSRASNRFDCSNLRKPGCLTMPWFFCNEATGSLERQYGTWPVLSYQKCIFWDFGS